MGWFELVVSTTLRRVLYGHGILKSVIDEQSYGYEGLAH